MSKRDIVRFLFKWKYSLFFLWLTVVGGATGFVYLLPPAYEAHAAVLIDGAVSPTLGTETARTVDVAALMDTEARILISRPVIEAVVDELKLHELSDSTGAFSRFKRQIIAQLSEYGLLPPVSRREGWVRSLSKDVTTKFGTNSQVMEILFANEDPRIAQAVVNSVTDQFIKHHLRVYANEGSKALYAQQVGLAKQRLDELIASYQTTKSNLGSDNNGQTRERLSAQLATLSATLGDLRLQQVDLEQRYGDEHPRMRALTTKIDETRARIVQAEHELADIAHREETLHTMESEIENQRAAYLDYVNRNDAAKLSGFANEKTTNVRLVEHAGIPEVPVRSRLFIILLAVIGGFAVALSITLLREYFDGHLDDAAQVERAMGVPVFATIPRA